MSKFSHTRQGPNTIIGISGKFTLNDKAMFQSFLEDNLSHTGEVMCIDARKLEYIDSAGIGDLIKLKMEAMKGYGRVCIVGLQDNVERIFRVSGLNSVFEVIDEDELQSL